MSEQKNLEKVESTLIHSSGRIFAISHLLDNYSPHSMFDEDTRRAWGGLATILSDIGKELQDSSELVSEAKRTK